MSTGSKHTGSKPKEKDFYLGEINLPREVGCCTGPPYVQIDVRASVDYGIKGAVFYL